MDREKEKEKEWTTPSYKKLHKIEHREDEWDEESHFINPCSVLGGNKNDNNVNCEEKEIVVKDSCEMRCPNRISLEC